jgi:RNA polymerase sigma factor (sigma-70 family)
MAQRSLHPLLHYLRRLSTGCATATDLDDAHLLHRFLRQGDQAAFMAIVQRYGALVWGVCVRRLGETPEAEDAFQATFLVLVRKAPGLRGPQLLGPWLYGVAHRTALKTHGRAVRRKVREQALPEDVGAEVGSEQLWGELRAVLDEELDRLPEKYRRPVLLCYLQGLSSEEAARALGCPKGTVFSRLSRARDLLRQRLSRRGLGASGAALAALLTAHAAAKAVPAALVEATLGVSILSAAGRGGPGVPAHLAALVEGVLRNMLLQKVRLGVVLLALGVAASGVGFLAHRALAGPPTTAAVGDQDKSKSAVAPAAPEPDRPAADKGKIAQPKAGAPAPAPPEPAQALKPRDLRKALTEPINFSGFDDPETTLDDVLQFMAGRYNLTFEVNEKAFQQEGLDFYGQTNKIGRPLPKMTQTTTAALLQKILARVAVSGGAAYLLRPSGAIEVTTTAAVRRELGIPERRPLLPLIWDDFENTPLNQAFERVAEASGFNVVIDPRVGDKTKTNITAQLNNVPTDTAVRLLADMAGLGVVQMDNVFYVTTRENAATLQAEQEQQNAAKPVAKPVEKPSPAKPVK